MSTLELQINTFLRPEHYHDSTLYEGLGLLLLVGLACFILLFFWALLGSRAKSRLGGAGPTKSPGTDQERARAARRI